MKNGYLLLALALISVQALNSRSAFAGGRSDGGGSYVVIDGETKVADPYYAGTPASQINKITEVKYADFPKELRGYAAQLSEFFTVMNPGRSWYNIAMNESWDRQVGLTLEEFIDRVYYLVPKDREDNVPCEHYLPILNRHVDAHFQYGCTFHGQTFLFVDKWTQASVKEQVLALFHESLWAQDPNADQAEIAALVSWTPILAKHYFQQAKAGDRTPLTAEELAGLDKFYRLGAKFGLMSKTVKDAIDNGLFKVFPGGGMTERSDIVKVDDKSFIGFGSVIAGYFRGNVTIENSALLQSYVFAGQSSVEIVDSELSGSITDKTRIVRSKVSGTSLHAGSVTDSVFTDSRLGQVEADHAKVNKSEWVYVDTYNEPLAQIHYADIDHFAAMEEPTEIKGTASAPVRIKDSMLFGDDVIVDEGTSIERASISDDHQGYIEKRARKRDGKRCCPA